MTAPWDPPPDADALPSLGDRSARLVATAIDRALPTGLGLFASFAGVGCAVAIPGALDGSLPWVAGLGALVFAATWIGQLTLLVRTGQTLGKRWMGLRVVGMDGGPVGWARMLLVRTLFPLALDQLCGGFVLLDGLLILAKDRRCAHDHLARTIVIRT